MSKAVTVANIRHGDRWRSEREHDQNTVDEAKEEEEGATVLTATTEAEEEETVVNVARFTMQL